MPRYIRTPHIQCWYGFGVCVFILAFSSFFSFFFFFFIHAFQGDKIYCSQLQQHCSRIVQGIHNHFIQKKNIKNGTHNTIHTFKNYFITIFLVFSKINCVQMDSKCNIFVPLNLHESIKCNSNPFLIFYLFKDCFMTHSANF